jgi:hypothetical protein
MLTRMSPKVYHALLELYTVLLHKNVTSVDIHTSEVRSMYTSGVKSKEKETEKKRTITTRLSQRLSAEPNTWEIYSGLHPCR